MVWVYYITSNNIAITPSKEHIMARKHTLQPETKTEDENHVHEDIDKREINVLDTLGELGTGN